MDISKCLNESCPSKKKCYRYMVEANPEYQSYAKFIVHPLAKKCDYFIHNTIKSISNGK